MATSTAAGAAAAPMTQAAQPAAITAEPAGAQGSLQRTAAAAVHTVLGTSLPLDQITQVTSQSSLEGIVGLNSPALLRIVAHGRWPATCCVVLRCAKSASVARWQHSLVVMHALRLHALGRATGLTLQPHVK